MAKNRVIGNGNQMPWHISAELQYFRTLTKGFPVITGRKNFESTGALPGRLNIVITRDLKFTSKKKNVIVTHSIESAIEYAKNYNNPKKIWIIGGGQIYQYVLGHNLVDYIYLTEISLKVEGDVFFPTLDNKWKIISSKTNNVQINTIDFSYTFNVYSKD